MNSLIVSGLAAKIEVVGKAKITPNSMDNLVVFIGSEKL
jgi:hypothetical protein